MTTTGLSKSRIKAVIADPSWLVRDGIARLFGELVPRSTIHTAADGSDLHRTLRGSPDLDIVLLGKDLVGDEEEALFRHVRKLAAGAAIGVIGDSFEHEDVRKAIYFGAMAVISIGGTRDDVIVALRKMLANEVVLPSTPVPEPRQPSAPRTPLGNNGLTQRESDVFSRLGDGLSVPLIAETLALSPHTIRVHIANIMKKLDLRDRSALMHRAVMSAAPSGRGGDAAE